MTPAATEAWAWPDVPSGGLRRSLRLSAAAAVVLLLTPLLAPLQIVALLAGRGGRRLPRLFHRSLARSLGLRVVVEGPRPSARATLFVANHLSWLDIPALGATLGGAFVAKAEVARWPLIGVLARLQPTVFVDRGARHGARGQAAAIRRRLAAGTDVILFPEGTSSDGRSVLPFKPALLEAACGLLDVAIQPVTLRYRRLGGAPVTRRTRPLLAWFGDMALLPHLWDLAGEGAVEAEVRLHPAIPADTAADRKQLGAACHRLVLGGYHPRPPAAQPEELP